MRTRGNLAERVAESVYGGLSECASGRDAAENRRDVEIGEMREGGKVHHRGHGGHREEMP